MLRGRTLFLIAGITATVPLTAMQRDQSPARTAALRTLRQFRAKRRNSAPPLSNKAQANELRGSIEDGLAIHEFRKSCEQNRENNSDEWPNTAGDDSRRWSQ